MNVPLYTAYVANGNGADMFRACLERRGCWKLLKTDAGDDTSSWNLWWGNNGQVCPFKRIRNRESPPAVTRSRLTSLECQPELCCLGKSPSRGACARHAGEVQHINREPYSYRCEAMTERTAQT